MQKKVLALHDLSGFGRSSLVPIIAAISAAGHQCVPLPTAYFSTHMAIPGWETVDLTGVMPGVRWLSRLSGSDRLCAGCCAAAEIRKRHGVHRPGDGR